MRTEISDISDIGRCLRSKLAGEAITYGVEASAAVNVSIAFCPWPHTIMVEKARRNSSPWKGDMAFPGGHIESGETPLEAAFRETFEETCISKDELEVIGALCVESPLSKPSLKTIAFLSLYKKSCLDIQRTPCSNEVSRIALVPVPRVTVLRRFLHPVRGIIVEGHKDWYGNIIWGMSLRILRRLIEVIWKCIR